MKKVFRYNEFLNITENYPSARNGFLVDTNFLISLTYELSKFYDKSIELHELMAEYSCKLFCNVNVRNEFLEVQRRIVLTEALISMNHDPLIKEVIPPYIRGRIRSLNTRRENALKKDKHPTILSDGELKSYAQDLSEIRAGENNLWEILCEDYLKDKLHQLWNSLENLFNVNFLSVRQEDLDLHLKRAPNWKDAIDIIEKYGLASSDAMIINIFLCTNFSFLVTSDKEVASIVKSINEDNKFVIIPNGIKLN